jgi:charged multivesicular body protein 1
MDKFEQQFEDVDVQTQYMDTAMNQTTTLSTPADQVDSLIQEVAEQHGLEVAEKFGVAIPAAPTAAPAAAVPAVAEQDELTQRLARLKG